MTLDTYTPAQLSTLPKGEYFTLRQGSTVVYCKGEYERSAKAWLCPKAEDISIERALRGTTVVFVGFTY